MIINKFEGIIEPLMLLQLRTHFL